MKVEGGSLSLSLLSAVVLHTAPRADRVEQMGIMAVAVALVAPTDKIGNSIWCDAKLTQKIHLKVF